jgi:hypothetical protein
MYDVIFPIKREAMVASTPNGILIYQTHFSASLYAQLEPKLAAARISGFTPPTLCSVVGAVKYAVVKLASDDIGSPALTAYLPTYSGSSGVSLLLNTL